MNHSVGRAFVVSLGKTHALCSADLTQFRLTIDKPFSIALSSSHLSILFFIRFLVTITTLITATSANMLYQALTTLDTAVLNDVRAHFRQPAVQPNPAGNDDSGGEKNPLLNHLNKLLEASGMSDPFAKIYVVTDPVESLPALLLFFVVTYVTKLTWDKDFATLVRAKATFGLDGVPLVVGIVTLLKQFHPSYTKRLLEYLGQFVRCTMASVLEKAKASASTGKVDPGTSSRNVRAAMPQEVTNTLLFIDLFCNIGKIPKSAVAEFVPSYILDSVAMS